MKTLTVWIGLLLSSFCAAAQQPQSPTTPIYKVNAETANGVAPGYAPCADASISCSSTTGLNLYLGPGTVNCNGVMVSYAGGTLALNASTTNYIYLNTASSCVPANKTTVFTTSDIPLAVVVTNGSQVTATCGSGSQPCITDDRTIFTYIQPSTSFVINSFTGCSGTLEIGATATNPTCSATYSSTPTSASITNTDSVDSPLVLTTPFTSGTIVGSFHHTAAATTTITLTAISGVTTKTATLTYTWNPRIFAGIGSAGASSSVTASGTTAVLSTSDVLSSAGLGTEVVGETFSALQPSGQSIYLLLTGNTHTFVDVGTGFPLVFNAPTTVTFVNQNGSTVTMYLYQSTNLLYGTYTPKVTS